MYRFEYFLRIEEKIRKNDYIYFFNSNYLFLEKIEEKDIFFSDKIVALSWDAINKNSKDSFPYERYRFSSAYIPYKKGKYYYQGGFYGAKSPIFLELCTECLKMIEQDKKRKHIAVWHDESYLNKYLLDKETIRVNEEYGMPQEWLKGNQKAKCILRDKNNYLGEKIIKNIKKRDKYKSNFCKKSIYFFYERLNKFNKVISKKYREELYNKTI